MFITFEGIEGCGKTTQIQIITKNLKEKGFSVISTKEPGGGGDFSLGIRHLLKSTADSLLLSELLAIYAARNEHIKKVIQPEAESNIIISDRYLDSSFAYYLYNSLKNESGKIIKTDEYFRRYEQILKLNEIIDIVYPDITVFFDISAQTAQDRANTRNGALVDKYDNLGKDNMSLIQYVYDELYTGIKNNSLKEFPPRSVFKVDAGRSVEEVSASILGYVTPLIKTK